MRMIQMTINSKNQEMKNKQLENCVFCKMVKGEMSCVKIWEDEKHFAFLDSNPIMAGHTLVIPKKHTDYVFDLSDEEYAELMLKSKKVGVNIGKKLGPKRVGIAVEGFGVPHVHIHLVPINKGYELNPLNAKPAKVKDLEKIAEKILK